MINLDKKNEYLNSIEEGFKCFGLNGFYEMHKDVKENRENPWENELENLNDLTYEEFAELAKTFLDNQGKRDEKSEKTITVGYDVFEKVSKYNHEDYYYMAEDQEGNLFETHYGSDGDDWYITAFENVQTGEYYMDVDNIVFYFKKIGRIPKKYTYNNNLENFVGKSLEKEEINGKVHYGFEDYQTNTFHVVK